MVPPHLFHRLKELILIVTNKCNLRCAYCYQDRADKTDMPWEIAKGAIDILMASVKARIDAGITLPEPKICFYGGESLIVFPLIRQAVFYAQAQAPQECPPRFELYTNGLLLDRFKIVYLMLEGFDVQISFDGVAPAHNDRGHGTFKRMDEVLDMLQRIPPFFQNRVRIAMTITSHNVPYFAESVRYFYEKGIGRIVFNIVQTYDPGWTDERLDILDVGRDGEILSKEALKQWEKIWKASEIVFRFAV